MVRTPFFPNNCENSASFFSQAASPRDTTPTRIRISPSQRSCFCFIFQSPLYRLCLLKPCFIRFSFSPEHAHIDYSGKSIFNWFCLHHQKDLRTLGRISVDVPDPPVPSHTYHNGTTMLPAVSLLRSSGRTFLCLRFRRSRSSLRCLPASEIRIPNRIFRLLLRRIYTSSFLQAPSSAPASLIRIPGRIFHLLLFRRNRSRYLPVAALVLSAVVLSAVVPPVAAAVP